MASGVRVSTVLSPRSASTAARSVAGAATPAAAKSGPQAFFYGGCIEGGDLSRFENHVYL